MIVEAKVAINGTKEAVWAKITDIENASKTISGIQKVEIIERPIDGLVGLKWRETRTLFGKTATETMWITDAAVNDFYKVRAESHGFRYISTLSISRQNGGTLLTMTHDSKPQTYGAKMLSVLLRFVFRGAMRKAIMKDLVDIKASIEQQAAG